MLIDLSISEITKKLRSKEITSEDLVNECYDRIEAYEVKINAFITLVDRNKAIEQAKNIKLNVPLAGIPFVMKDAYVTRGIRTTAASKVLDTYIPQYNAEIYDRVEKNGAILIGKMNMDAWGHGASTENTDYDSTKNPWDITRSTGGSGGGPAAALAMRYCSFAIGEDTGGSIRCPAAWSNVTGLKVTYGRVSRYGAIAYASSLDTVGPTAKTVEDCALILEVIAGKDGKDATSSPFPVPQYSKVIRNSVKGKRIGYPIEFYKHLDETFRATIWKTRDVFISLGAIVEDVSLPLFEYGVPLYYILAPSETSSNLSRYDGVRFGNGRDGFTRETKRRIMTGTYALSAGYYDAFYKKAQAARSIFIQKYSEVLNRFDAIVSPVMPIAPSKFGQLVNDPMKNMMADIYTVTVNVVGVPSLALPAGFDDQGLPVGMQLIGKMFDEQTLLQLGYAYQQVTDWHVRKPSLLL